MVRIIAGKYKNKRIETLKKNDTRPTGEKLRESMFSSLGSMYGDILDLFGGSGALTIEALSRGGERAVIIDGAVDALKVIKSNIRDLQEDIEVYRNDYRRALKALHKRGRQFDFIFIDPPYHKELANIAIHMIDELDLLKSDGVIIVESAKNENIEVAPFTIEKVIEQGTTKCQFLRRGLDD
ncbi:16S rRNA (guanine(966)-N(2))-methyltransferase RsmD [Phocicoccus pinnipedialis]|uniref:16S rRNA (guanine(966)-N(2))-methyltransferase RsmD n=1 Tax=Phocicoccus pinnipedialis TaxID=110845 RepID=UPI002FCD691F